MIINVTVQFEAFVHAGEDMPRSAWWAESPNLPRFSAVAPSLAELRNRVLLAVADLMGERGESMNDVELRYSLAPVPPATGAEQVNITTDLPLIHA